MSHMNEQVWRPKESMDPSNHHSRWPTVQHNTAQRNTTQYSARRRVSPSSQSFVRTQAIKDNARILEYGDSKLPAERTNPKLQTV